MAAPGNLGAQAVTAFDIGLGFTAQDQRLRRIQWWPANHFATHQPVHQVRSVARRCPRAEAHGSTGPWWFAVGGLHANL